MAQVPNVTQPEEEEEEEEEEAGGRKRAECHGGGPNRSGHIRSDRAGERCRPLEFQTGILEVRSVAPHLEDVDALDGLADGRDCSVGVRFQLRRPGRTGQRPPALRHEKVLQHRGNLHSHLFVNVFNRPVNVQFHVLRKKNGPIRRPIRLNI